MAETGPGQRYDSPAPDRDFAAMILTNLKAAGVQQAHKEDKIIFSGLTGWPGRFIRHPPDDRPVKVEFCANWQLGQDLALANGITAPPKP
jgi:hypothetical protein